MTTNDGSSYPRGLNAEQVRLLHETRGLTPEGIDVLPESALRRALRRLEYPDMPRAREAFRLLQKRDELGHVPEQAQLTALRQLSEIRVDRAAGPQVAGVPTGGGVSVRALGMQPPPAADLGAAGAAWVPLGPGDVGGRTRALLFHPSEHDTIWAASAGGGVWRTDDGGGSWLPVDDLMANLATTSLVMDPNDSDVVYAGTGEGFFNADALRGGGIFRTVDGTTWSHLPATADSRFADVNRLAINASGEVLLAGGSRGLHRSEDPDRTAWATVLEEGIGDVRFHPTDPMRAVAGALRGGAVWITSDAGLTWDEAAHDVAWGDDTRVEVTYALADPEVVYASVDAGGGQIWRSSNGGTSFFARGSLTSSGEPAAYLGDQGWYSHAIWAGHPADADFVVVGGLDLWRSSDGGDTLEEMSTWWADGSAHADQHAIVAHPAFDGDGNASVFFGNDGGIYVADDVRTVGDDPPERVRGWTELNNDYAVTQFYAAAVNADGVVVGGTQDNGTLAMHPQNGTRPWRTIFGGDGGFCGSDPDDPSVFYGEYVFLNIHRNTDGATTDDQTGDRYISGQFFDQVAGWSWKQIPFKIPDAQSQRALFIAPFLLDPNDADTMLAGGESLWRTNDVKAPNTPTSGPQWTRIKPPSPDPAATTGRPNSISAVTVQQGSSDVIWVGYVDGQVWRTVNGTDAQPVWSRIDGTGPDQLSTGRFCTQIAVSPHDPAVVLATFGGYVVDNVWRSDDSGATWRSVHAGLPAAPIRAVTVHPRLADLIYLGTEVGLFASDDGGASWSATNQGPTSCSVEDLLWHGETLYCVTHGRGMFQIDLSGV
jgi:hypothetical protein